MIREMAAAARSLTTLLRADSRTKHRADMIDMGSPLAAVWQNLATGLGGQRDRLSAHVPTGVRPLNERVLEALYYGDPFAKRIIVALVHEAFRLGFSIEYRGDITRSREMLSDIATIGRELGLPSKARMAAVLGRQYGGAGLFIETNGGLDFADSPLDLERVRHIDSLSVFDRREVLVSAYQIPQRGQGEARFPEHAMYMSATVERSNIAWIHSSRFVGFGGMDTPARDRKMYFRGWDAPVLQPVWETLRRFNSGHQSTDTMLTDASVAVQKVNNLWKVMTSEGARDTFEERMKLQDLYRWVGSVIPVSVDKDGEESFEYVERTFTGIPDLLREKKFLVAAAAEIPVSVLFGQSPAGLNATGEHDAKNWHASVASYQADGLTPQLRFVVQLIARELGATDPEEFDIEWPNLEQLTAKEQAELEKIHADTDEIRIGQGFPEETVLLHRHGGDKYRMTPPMLTLEDKVALEANLRAAREAPEEEPAPATDPSDPEDEDEDADEIPEDEKAKSSEKP